MDTFLASSFGTFMMTLFQGTLSVPSWQNFTYLACGWTLAWGRQTITTSMWLSGAAAAKHFSRYYAFWGGPLYKARCACWRRIIHYSATLVPPDEVMNIDIDDGTIKNPAPTLQALRITDTARAAHVRNIAPCGG